MWNRPNFVLVLLVLTAASTPIAEATTTSVSIIGFSFQPGSVTVAEGDVVRWTNQDAAAHTATADDGAFDSGNLGNGGTFAWDTTGRSPGTYAYTCLYHPSMTGSVIIQAIANTAPTASFTTQANGLRLSVDASSSSDADGSIQSFAWAWGDGTAAGSGATATHLFTASGTFAVTLTVTDNSGNVGTKTTSVTVTNLPPVAAFSHTPAHPITGMTVAFTDASTDADGTVARWEWDFGDGMKSGARNPSHAFKNSSSFTVTLRVEDGLGASGTKSQTIDVGNAGPTAAFTITPASPRVDELVTFSDGSTDPDDGIATWHWDLGDGNTGSSASPNHTYTSNGTYAVTLVVTDATGANATAVRTLLVRERDAPANAPPVASFHVSANGLDVEVDASDSFDPNGMIARFAWSWGDDTASDGGAQTTHTYAVAGAYTITLTVTDGFGEIGSASQNITLARPNDPPIARFGIVVEGSRVAVDARESSDPDGEIASYAWDWGDGSPVDSGKTAAHEYARSGDYIITLTVTDGAHGTGTTELKAKVGTNTARDGVELTIAIPPVDPSAVVTHVFNATVRGMTVTVRAPANVSENVWEFGDGSSTEGDQATHTYTSPGTYVVLLTSLSETGAVVRAAQNVTIARAEPAEQHGTPPPTATPGFIAWMTAIAFIIVGAARAPRKNRS